MRIRSGHIVVLVIVLLCAMLSAVLLLGGGTEATPDTTAVRGASLPPVGTDPSAVPQIEVETKEKDMGIVSNAGMTVKPFVLKNTGRATLVIHEVKTSCACTTPLVTQDGLDIAPGAQGSFNIQIDPRRIPGFETRKVLTIISNDPKSPQIEVGVTSHVDPEFELEPQVLNFGDIEKGDPATINLVVKQLGDRPLEITELNTVGSLKHDAKEAAAMIAHARNFVFSVARRPEASWASPGKAEYDLSVSLTPEVAAGALATRWVYLVTNVARMPAMAIPVSGNVIAPYEVSPKAPMKINLKADPITGALTTGTATIKATAPLTIDAIDAQGAPVVATAAGTTPNEARLNVELRDDAPPGPLEADIKFTVVMGEKRFTESVGVRAFVSKNPAPTPSN